MRNATAICACRPASVMVSIRHSALLVLLCGACSCAAQTAFSGDIEPLEQGHKSRHRTLQYVPRDDGFYCIDGHHRYTRALYGGWSGYRLETSDRPLFALFQDSKNCRNVAFTLTFRGKTVALDSTDHCEAIYKAGRRQYVLSDQRWGHGARLLVTAVCLNDRDAALWEFSAQGFDQSPTLRATLCNIKARRLLRNGDYGVDAPDAFEADGEPQEERQWLLPADTPCYAMAEGLHLVECSDGATLMATCLQQNDRTARRIRFNTPDPYINALDDALLFAADGAWDGKTWLHGAIGWRTQLNGWRGGYLADVLGYNDRARSHFSAYAASQVTDVPPTIAHPTQDPTQGLSRALKQWGTQMYSNGYICRKPNNPHQMHHYDMNLNYVDELLWHFEYDADTAYMREMWPVMERHLAWEKRNFDPDGDHLYDAYCCIWASDALYYSGGAVTHSSAYNYRANRLAAKMARRLGLDGRPYEEEANAILKAMNERLWAPGQHWAEYQDLMGLKRVHTDAALWSIYTPVDCGVGTAKQMYQNTLFVDSVTPHFHIDYTIPAKYAAYPKAGDDLYVVSTTRWMPYSWSINNVASAEIMNTALAFYTAGRPDAAFRLLKGNIMDQMYLSDCPANFGQVSFYDAARGECYRDFSDNTGTSARALLQGLFGIVPHALDGKCLLRPSFPEDWEEAAIETPYLSYAFRREGGTDVYTVSQRFAQPLKITLRQTLGGGRFVDHEGTADSVQTFRFATIAREKEHVNIGAGRTVPFTTKELGLEVPEQRAAHHRSVDLSRHFNANVSDIFRDEYRSPRPPYTTLQIPIQGIGQWCHPEIRPEINDSVFRSKIRHGRFHVAGTPFRTPAKGHNVAFTSLWDNHPSRLDIPLSGKVNAACLLLAGSTNHMQSHIDNAIVVVRYADESTDTLHLIPPYNWCPIEQDYYDDGAAFSTLSLKPYRVCLGTGNVSRTLADDLGITRAYDRALPGGAAQLLRMPLDSTKPLRAISVIPLANDVIVGLMGLTLEH